MTSRLITTLCGANLATAGTRFLASDPARECYPCPLFTQCVGKLESGRVYDVVEVRSKSLACPIHEGGVIPVVVSEAAQQASVEKRIAVEGLTISFQTPVCFEYDCPNYTNCFPVGLVSGDRVTILEANSKSRIDCRIGRVLNHVMLGRTPRAVSPSSSPQLKTSV